MPPKSAAEQLRLYTIQAENIRRRKRHHERKRQRTTTTTNVELNRIHVKERVCVNHWDNS